MFKLKDDVEIIDEEDKEKLIEKLKYREDNIEMQIEAYADKINELVDEINELKKVGSK